MPASPPLSPIFSTRQHVMWSTTWAVLDDEPRVPQEHRVRQRQARVQPSPWMSNIDWNWEVRRLRKTHFQLNI